MSHSERSHAAAWAVIAGLAVALAGCQAPTVEDRDTTTLRLERDDASGELQYCDDTGCSTVPNPGDCAVLVVEIDNVNGGTCETCYDAAGGQLSATCDDTVLQCVVITAPEPDCVVCAQKDGGVVHSSCVVSEPYYCESYGGGDADPSGGAVPPPEPGSGACQRCWDAAGDVIIDSCREGCANVICPAIACAPGYQTVQRPGECCPVCVPPDTCGQVTCSFDAPVPDCPPDTVLRRDPADCCRYFCEYVACPGGSASDPTMPIIGPVPCTSDADCAGGACVDGTCTAADCPPGYARDFEFPSCGACVPVDDTRYCQSDLDCGADETCTVGDECLMPDCGCYSQCDANGSCEEICGNCQCSGICRPSDVVCGPTEQPQIACEGYWETPGRDANGCPYPPVCVCDDGSIALDGSCADRCAGEVCVDVVFDCEPGTHAEYAYPYCCGVCVPDDTCWTMAGEVCVNTACQPGYACLVGPACEPMCVPERVSCSTDLDCGSDEICSTTWGDCSGSSEKCDVASGVCNTRCTGSCVPRDATGYCADSSACTPDQVCSTELGECLPSPGCASGDPACVWECLGTCLDPR